MLAPPNYPRLTFRTWLLRLLCLLAAITAIVISSGVALAGPLSFDPTTGIVREALLSTPLPDGKLLALDANGDFGETRSLVRFNADGTPDPAFSTTNLRFGSITAIRVLAGSQILVAAELVSDDGTPAPFQLLKLNVDGSIDETFQPGTNYSDTPIVLPEGKLLLVENSYTDDGTLSSKVVRLNGDGSIDGAFDASAALGSRKAPSVYLQNDGKILLTSFAGNDTPTTLTRLNSDGSLDPTFNVAPLPPGFFEHLLPLPDGKVAAAFVHDSDDDANGTSTVFRFNADGSLDTAFHPPTQFDDWVRTLFALPDGGLIVAGDFAVVDGTPRAGLARLATDGTLDLGYDAIGSQADSALYDFGGSGVVVEPSGGVFAVVYNNATDTETSSDTSFLVEHFAPDGSLLGSVPVTDTFECSLAAKLDAAGVIIRASGPLGDPIFSTGGPLLPGTGPDGGFSPPPATGVAVVRDLPVVTITAATPKTFSGTRDPGQFIVERTGTDYSKRLRVVYRVGGSAVAGQDYRSLKGVRIIPPGQRTARIRVRPVGEQFARVSNGRVDVTVKLASRPGYKKGERHAARVKIIDRESLLNHHG